MSQSAFVVMPEHQSTTPSPNDQARNDQIIDDPQISFERITRSVSAVGAATYHWNIETDKITWHGDLGQVFNHVDPKQLGDGRAFASLLDPDNFTSRFETVMRTTSVDDGSGVAFSIEYSVKPYGRDQEHSIWIEDSGRWYAGPNGRPLEVYGIVRQIDDRHKQDQHLQFLGNCDPLTGMMNRGRLAEALGETIELARAEDHSSAFLLISVSNLAIVNDAYGFDVADEVIIKIGQRLREVVRTGDVIGRYSGSKFGIILARATNEELHVAAERFLTIARQKVIETDLGPVWAMLSIGGVVLPNESEDAYRTMAHAEEALTDAAKLATDGVVIYAPSAELVSERNLNSRCAVEIVRSLKENNFTLAYQPVVDAQTKEVVFHEALLRMKCDNGDIVTAGYLIPISEKLGLVRLIDQFVVNKVLSALRQFPEARIALNISGVTANDQRWFGKITEILEENIDVTDRLTVEITETVVLEDINQTIAFIEKLHELGCKVAIDDFGAGFTSFKNLKVLNVDKVKIDGSFCQNLSQNKDNQFFVHTLIDLSKKFDLEVVAEWVENEEDSKLLSDWGVDYLQGRLYGMAESTSPWGEPLHDEDLCVVPSEIMQHENENLDGDDVIPDENQFDQNHFDGAIPNFSDNADNGSIEPQAEFISITQPFEAIVPAEKSSIAIPELPIENVDTVSVAPTGTSVSSDVEQETEVSIQDHYSEQSNPLDDEIQKLKDAITQLSQAHI